jgi:endonuclease/exonuclease/phosphatase family metal-dependent hydrolase
MGAQRRRPHEEARRRCANASRSVFVKMGSSRVARMRTRTMRFTVATYNIHKGFTQLKGRMVIHELRERLRGLSADVLFLQEVQGVHRRNATRYRDWPGKSQHEFIADSVWHEVAYGKNASYRDGHHGNALLSRFPITRQENEDISAHVFESRGMLHCVLKPGPRMPELHCLNVHLGLFERGRQWQIHSLVERIRATVPRAAPLIIAGDFNDWRHKANRALIEDLGVVEVFEEVEGRTARTYPSLMPMFRLDRIYARGLNVLDARVHYAFPGNRLSDHAALAATLELSARAR